MSASTRADLRFVRQVLAVGSGTADGVGWVAGAASLPARRVEELVARGVLHRAGDRCTAAPETAGWVRRMLLEAAQPGDGFAAQHRDMADAETVPRRNLADDALARLGRPDGKERTAFLSPMELEAGQRLRRLWQRAGLTPRLTMQYSPARMTGGGGGAGEVSDMAADARRRFNRLLAGLPAECRAVVFEICADLKGLQQIETERGWPRRSAKLVLRIGLSELARAMGLADEARGPEGTRIRSVQVSPEATQ